MNHWNVTETIFLLKARRKLVSFGLLNNLADNLPYPLLQCSVPYAAQWGHMVPRNHMRPITEIMIYRTVKRKLHWIRTMHPSRMVIG